MYIHKTGKPMFIKLDTYSIAPQPVILNVNHIRSIVQHMKDEQDSVLRVVFNNGDFMLLLGDLTECGHALGFSD